MTTDHGIFSLLWQQNTGIGRLILLLLLALGSAAAAAALRHLHRYRSVERRALDGVRAKLRAIRAREEGEPPEGGRPALPAPVDLAELRENLPPRTL
ncbi:MAG TPA: hypothetical protein VJT67_15675, partial [Longimicrobiaceae bacterium]|nr:hypothetical protein [Longimicrobiaceae bacterium]